MRYVRKRDDDTDWSVENEVAEADDRAVNPTAPTARTERRRREGPMSRGVTRRMEKIDTAILRMARGEEVSIIPPASIHHPAVQPPPPLPFSISAPPPLPLQLGEMTMTGLPPIPGEPLAPASSRVSYYSLVPREPEPFTLQPPKLFSFVPRQR